ncbi:MAG: hypothetical protein PHR77_17215 [Kiritimatiellae bacterium]|nr:hypothetical protein [Kiritimatiellia bacterium]MDD5520427.1 hypothetical protein [Kiritimatiellia bacterium]
MGAWNQMKKRWYIVLVTVMAIVITGCIVPVFAETNVTTTSSSGQALDWDSALARVRNDIALASKDLERANAALRKYEHDVVYTNKEISHLYMDMKKLEKEMAKKRQALNDMMFAAPEAMEKNNAYQVAYKKLGKLRQQEQDLLRKMGKKDVR